MILPEQTVRIMIVTRPVDIRKGHDALAAIAQGELGSTPGAGVMVVFRSCRGDRIKILLWDCSGVPRLSLEQFEALPAGLDRRLIRAPRPVLPGAAE
ncbi:IS66 family insertion sequence element accessory protein TnpB [Gemmobacter sp. 24YEA27]|uniref:IS66 family insertion sequence element accessory protein TnpB n=1 Tax=Gemmobacter sp. 24YEA27 TaxID=3040672 RepID=UPI0024B3B89D|nr:IS66 family insertion sequence element accessory protein TnpB [Gemmobacter sp. 24YEA27]